MVSTAGAVDESRLVPVIRDISPTQCSTGGHGVGVRPVRPAGSGTAGMMGCVTVHALRRCGVVSDLLRAGVVAFTGRSRFPMGAERSSGAADPDYPGAIEVMHYITDRAPRKSPVTSDAPGDVFDLVEGGLRANSADTRARWETRFQNCLPRRRARCARQPEPDGGLRFLSAARTKSPSCVSLTGRWKKMSGTFSCSLRRATRRCIPPPLLWCEGVTRQMTACTSVARW